MTEGEVFVYYAAFPYSIKGVTTPNSDGTYTIYINSVLPEAQQRAALRHELSHVREAHFYDGASVRDNEIAADTDRTDIPRDALLFARGRGRITGSGGRHFLSVLNATVDKVLERMA